MAILPNIAPAVKQAQRLPVAFMSHGGGPWTVHNGATPAEKAALTASLQAQAQALEAQPKALLVISAHWEEAVPTVMTAASPPMLYDYYGFPAAAYKISWPAPGSPELGRRVQELLGAAGFKSAANAKRGFDHGTFVPLMMAYPKAHIPAIQLSLNANLDPRDHMAMGRALQPLREEGVYIIASGMTYHNMSAFRQGQARQHAEVFSDWLLDAVTKRTASERAELIEHWENAPSGRTAHPREEHLMPLMVAIGAAGEDAATVAFDGPHMGVRCLSFMFG